MKLEEIEEAVKAHSEDAGSTLYLKRKYGVQDDGHLFSLVSTQGKLVAQYMDKPDAELFIKLRAAAPALLAVARAAEDIQPAHPAGCKCSACQAYRALRRALADLEEGGT